MPFGSVFGTIVFGILGPVLGLRMIGAPAAPLRVIGACFGILGLSVAAGLLMRRAWARWLGVATGVWFAWSAASSYLARGGTFHLTVAIAGSVVAVLLLVPATGRAARGPADPPPAPSLASLALLCGAFAAITGVLGATAWAVLSAPAVGEATAFGRTRDVESRRAARADNVAWHDFADGLKQAKSARKLIVADFYATWCGPCKVMEKRTFRDPRVLARLRDVVPVRVDAEETSERGGLKGIDLALRYAVEVYPTIVVVDGEGHELARNDGFMGPDEFLSWIDAVIERAGTAIARS